jgi:hypothetical protein
MGYTVALGKFPGYKLVDGFKVNLLRENSQADEPLGPPKGLVYHWSAGTYDQAFDAYHYSIVFDKAKQKAHVIKNLSVTQKGQHLWTRNSNMLAISFSAMRGAVNTTNHAGLYPVTPEMITAAAKLGAELCAWYSIDPRSALTLPKKKIMGQSLVPVQGTIEVPAVTDHATVAKFDQYFPDRVDVGSFMVPIKYQLNDHYDKLKSKTAEFMYKGIVRE